MEASQPLQQYTILQRSIHAQLNSGMGTNLGQPGLSHPGEVAGGLWGGGGGALSNLRTTGVTEQA